MFKCIFNKSSWIKEERREKGFLMLAEQIKVFVSLQVFVFLENILNWIC